MYNFKGFTAKSQRGVELRRLPLPKAWDILISAATAISSFGLLKEGTGVAATVLNKSGSPPTRWKNEIRTKIGTGSETQLTADLHYDTAQQNGFWKSPLWKLHGSITTT